MDTNVIVVGTDGSGPGAAAVRWAAREAQRRGADLRVVLAHNWIWPGARFDVESGWRRLADEQAETTLGAAVVRAREVAPDVTVRHDIVPAEAVPALLDAGKRASIVVVGNRGWGGFGSLMLGSVSQQVAAHAPCPVVVVRGRLDIVDGPVVVGVDGSSSSLDALRMAYELAAERQAPLVAVRAYEPPSPPWAAVDVEPVGYDAKQRDAAEHETLAESLAPWREKYPEVAVEALVAQGGAARVLVGVSHTAQVIVVGSRGHGSFTGTVLGSVGMQLLHHADCPVLIVHPPTDA